MHIINMGNFAREQDEHITEAQFVNLSYLQARHDYLLGNYPVVRDDAAQMCALQIFAAHGDAIADKADEFMKEVEKHIAKQVQLVSSQVKTHKYLYKVALKVHCTDFH